jgi:uncharacterized protein GlcG (DUF336 family)
MHLLHALWRRPNSIKPRALVPLRVERLEPRDLPAVASVLAGGLLTITGGPERTDIRVLLDTSRGDLVVYDHGLETARFASAAVSAITINGSAGARDRIIIDKAVTQPAQIIGGAGNDVLQAGGGPTTILGDGGNNKIVAGTGIDVLAGQGGTNHFFKVKPVDTVTAGPGDKVSLALPVPVDPPATVLSTADVSQLLQRAAAATASDDGIVAIVDRGGRLLGLRVEGNVSPQITGNTGNLVFAIDGALAEARTAAFFANNAAPLTSRTIQFISQTTITQREVESNPSITDPNSVLRGPGFVAPIGIHGHFPPEIPHTPQVDLFNIEGNNRDRSIGPDGTPLPSRFNVPLAFIPPNVLANPLAPPDSYGLISGLEPTAQPRGIGTLPGGIPIYKNGELVGGIGVFFPGTTGYADEENSSLQSNFNPLKLDRAMEAEYVAFAAVGGSAPAGVTVGSLGGVAPVAGVGLPFGRIDLVGITLPLFGPAGQDGPQTLVQFGSSLGVGNPNSGTNQKVDPGGDLFKSGTPVPDGWLVTPHDGVGVTAAEVQQIVAQGIVQANQTRAAIRLPLDSTTRMVFAVADRTGSIVGLYRMPDATVFSIDVAVAKARNVAYYADPAQLQPIDQTDGVPAGVAFTNRTFRYLALPRYPEGVDGAPPGQFSILNDGGTNPATGLNVGPPLPASAFQSVQGHDAFNPGTNFHDPNNPLNQNGIVFFPGSSPLYRNGVSLIGGFGVSGDGVDQDDVVTVAGATGLDAPPPIQVDQFFSRGVRLPYQKFDRNPEG